MCTPGQSPAAPPDPAALIRADGAGGDIRTLPHNTAGPLRRELQAAQPGAVIPRRQAERCKGKSERKCSRRRDPDEKRRHERRKKKSEKKYITIIKII